MTNATPILTDLNLIQVMVYVFGVLLAAGIIALFKMNATLIKLQSWQLQHEKVEDDRSGTLTQRLNNIDIKISHEHELAMSLVKLADVLLTISDKL
jgi:hypothetical protein